MEVLRPRPERSLPARPAGPDRATRHRVVPLARLGLHIEEGHDDDQAPGATANDDDCDQHVAECTHRVK